MILYDAFLPVASQVMVRFVSSVLTTRMLLMDMPGHIAKLIGMPNYSRHVGQGEAGISRLCVWLFTEKLRDQL